MRISKKARVHEPALTEDEMVLTRLADPFAQVFRLVKLLAALLGVAVIALLVQGFWLRQLATQSSAHVYEIHPDGVAAYVGNREANLLPRPFEAVHVAKEFVKLLYAHNSSTVDNDVAAAVSMCATPTRNRIREEIAEADQIALIRESQMRSEVTFEEVRVLEHGRHASRVAVRARLDKFGLTQYEGAPFAKSELALEIALSTVPRDPDHRPNGLEVVRVAFLDNKSSKGR